MLFLASSWNLQAFSELIRLGSFSNAAKSLHLTQPALSLRIKQLEKFVGRPLLKRSRKGIQITAEGQRVLEYINLREKIDQEFHGKIRSEKQGKFCGILRLAGHFSIITYVALPALASLFKVNPDLQVQCLIREDDEVPLLFERGECDLALLQRPLQNETYANVFLGYENYVFIESTRYKARQNVLIDSDLSDTLTDDFFRAQKKNKRLSHYERSFMHNEVCIARSVELGFGRAVVAEQEFKCHTELRRVRGYATYKLPAYLQHVRSLEHSRMLCAVRDGLLIESPKYLCKQTPHLPDHI